MLGNSEQPTSQRTRGRKSAAALTALWFDVTNDNLFLGVPGVLAVHMKELKLDVPTYNANYYPNDVASGRRPEFGEPTVPVLIRDAAGVRIAARDRTNRTRISRPTFKSSGSRTVG